MDRGYYKTSSGTWNEKAEKTSNSKIWLYTTGSSDQNRALNIYDFGGNLSEFTLERSTSPVTLRGLNFYGNGYASLRLTDSFTTTAIVIRLALHFICRN